MQSTWIAVPKIEFSMLSLQITALSKGARKNDLERVVSAFEVLFDWHSVGNELVVGSRVW